ncbi:hypothetical protein [Umezakia ovalisporum]|uniref:Uncharacterized protein n=1 Tax=Umezakia ovalisporum FSS-43 TaxID=2740520 RepID=A0ABT6K4A4_9CYAN|nr:hypothetical protein [Umezakia ovalisporum]MDH6057152.1 hypothetical protein [Umezakia ovalisporum FSS-43]
MAWIDNEGIPRFDPFDVKVIGQPNLFTYYSQRHLDIPPEVANLELNQLEPLVLSPHQCNFRVVNVLAIRKSQKNDQPISWAFSVEALEKPRNFQIIQPASTRAYEILQRAIKQIPQGSTSVVEDEEALKSAIRNLMNSSQVKPEVVQVITDALKNQQITAKHWHSLFDGQGAKTAIIQKIYSPQIVRLMTLRAMVIPETLPEFLNWLNGKLGKSGDEHQVVSFNFQSAICSQFPKDNLTEGIKLLVPKLLQGDITPELFCCLFIKDRAWYVCRNDFINDVRYDLELIYRFFQSGTVSNIFPIDGFKFKEVPWEKIIQSWRPITQGYYRIDDYEPLAQLFELLREYPLSAYFYQISRGNVPKNVFLGASPNPKNKVYSLTFLGLTLKKDISLIEGIVNFFLARYIVPIQFVIIFSIILSGGSFWIGSQFFPKSTSDTASSKQPTLSGNQKVVKTTANEQAPSTAPVDEMPKNVKIKANETENVNKTITAIEQLKKEPEFKGKDVLREIKNILDPQFDYELIKKGNNGTQQNDPEKLKQALERIKLSEAIYLYEKKKVQEGNSQITATGYIYPNRNTYKLLKEQIKENLTKKNN